MEDGDNMQDQFTTKLLEAKQPTSFSANEEATSSSLVVLSTLVCGSFASGFTSGYTSPTESAIMEDLNMSVAQFSVFGSLMTVGGVIGSLVNGKLADLVGRRGAMWISELFSIAGWFAIAFTKVAWLLDLGRVLTGIGIGINIFVVPVYIAEITPKNIRGAFTYSNQFMFTCGFSLVYFLGTIISWRSLALVGSVPCILHVLGLFFIPESPRWLAKIGRDIESKATLQRLRGKHVDVSEESASIEEYTGTFHGHPETRFLDLFQRRYARPVTIGVVMMLFLQLTGANVIGSYMSSIFEKADFPTNIGQTSVAVIEIPSVLISVLLIEKCGRRPLLMVSISGLGLSCFLVGLAFFLKGSQAYFEQDIDIAVDATPILVYIGLMGYAVAICLGILGLPWVIISEIFPMNIKASAGSLATLSNWICSWVVTYAFNFVMAWSPSGTFFFFCCICFVAGVLVAKFVPETKGRALEEIQESLVGALPEIASRA